MLSVIANGCFWAEAMAIGPMDGDGIVTYFARFLGKTNVNVAFEVNSALDLNDKNSSTYYLDDFDNPSALTTYPVLLAYAPDYFNYPVGYSLMYVKYFNNTMGGGTNFFNSENIFETKFFSTLPAPPTSYTHLQTGTWHITYSGGYWDPYYDLVSIYYIFVRPTYKTFFSGLPPNKNPTYRMEKIGSTENYTKNFGELEQLTAGAQYKMTIDPVGRYVPYGWSAATGFILPATIDYASSVTFTAGSKSSTTDLQPEKRDSSQTWQFRMPVIVDIIFETKSSFAGAMSRECSDLWVPNYFYNQSGNLYANIRNASCQTLLADTAKGYKYSGYKNARGLYSTEAGNPAVAGSGPGITSIAHIAKDPADAPGVTFVYNNLYDVEVEVAGLEDNLVGEAINPIKQGFSPALTMTQLPGFEKFQAAYNTPHTAKAPNIIFDPIYKKYYRLKKAELYIGNSLNKTIVADPNNNTDAQIPFDFKLDSTTVSYRILWTYDRVLRLNVSVAGALASNADPKQCIGASLAGETCIASPLAAFSSISYFPILPTPAITLFAKSIFLEGTDNKACTGLIDNSGNISSGSLINNGTYNYVTFVMQDSMDLVWNYNNQGEINIGSEVSLPLEIDSTKIKASGPFKFENFSAPFGNTVENSFFWDAEQKKLFAVREIWSVDIVWYETVLPALPLTPQTIRTVWPTTIDIVSNVPVDLNSNEWTYVAVHYPDNNTTQAFQFENGHFSALWKSKYVLRFQKEVLTGPTTSKIISSFVVLDAYPWDSPEHIEYKTVAVGTSLEHNSHTEKDKTGYVYYPLSVYDSGLYDRTLRKGQIIPVNRSDLFYLKTKPEYQKQLVVVWYRQNSGDEDPGLNFSWPTTPVAYRVLWPHEFSPPQAPDGIISIALGEGFLLPPDQVNGGIYAQPDPANPGFNPNEEHALQIADRLYALRADLNAPLGYSPPYVLYQYKIGTQWQTKVIKVENGTIAGKEQEVGSLLQPPPPLDRLPLMTGYNYREIVWEAGYDQGKAWLHTDKNGSVWIKAAPHDATAGKIVMKWYYPMQPGFYWPEAISPGDPLPFLRGDSEISLPTSDTKPIDYVYTPVWPKTAPVLPIGDSLQTAKYGLPNIANQTSISILHDQGFFQKRESSVELVDALAERRVSLAEIPAEIETEMVNGRGTFPTLPFHLNKRLSYDAARLELVFAGYQDKAGIIPMLLPNVMSGAEKAELVQKGTPLTDDQDAWNEAINALYNLSRDPDEIGKKLTLSNGVVNSLPYGAKGTTVGACGDADDDDDNYDCRLWLSFVDNTASGTMDLLPRTLSGGVPGGKVLSAGRATSSGYVVLAFNDDPGIVTGDPVSLKVIRVNNGPVSPQIKAMESTNPFDESLTLRLTNDFGFDPQKFFVEWCYKPISGGLDRNLPNLPGDARGWIPFASGWGKNEVTLRGPNLLALSDNQFIARYYYGNVYASLLPVTPAPVYDPSMKEAVVDPHYWSTWSSPNWPRDGSSA